MSEATDNRDFSQAMQHRRMPFPIGTKKGQFTSIQEIHPDAYPQIAVIRVPLSGANFDAYTANDTVGSVMRIPRAARRPGGGGTILSVSLVDDDEESITAELAIFTGPPNTPTADDAAWGLDSGDKDKFLDFITIATYADYSGVDIGHTNNVNLPFACEISEQDLFFQVITRGALDLVADSDYLFIFTIEQL